MVEIPGQSRLPTDVPREFRTSSLIGLKRDVRARVILPNEPEEAKPTWISLQTGKIVTIPARDLWHYHQAHKGEPGIQATIQDPKNPDQEINILLPRSAFTQKKQPSKPQPVQEIVRVIDDEENAKITKLEEKLKTPKPQASEQPIKKDEGIDLFFPFGASLFINEPEKSPGESRKQRTKSIVDNADWIVGEKSLLRVRKSDTLTDAHWYLAEVLGLTKADQGKLNKDGKFKLQAGQLVYITKGAYFKALRLTREIRQERQTR